MNAPLARALVQDAFYQVLDNKVFRLLVLIVIVMVSPTWLVALREDGISIFWGWRKFGYEELGPIDQQADLSELHVAVIQGLQSLLVENLAGTIGVIFCIAATAFFVPRMLEKGAADTLFSKPVSRITLLLARYFSGILFVAILSSILIVGMHLGLLVMSGYSDPGFLWGILTLTYLYAIVHAFSVCVGVMTRSSAAAILLSIVFFIGSSCVHGGWITKEHYVEKQRMDDMRGRRPEDDGTAALREAVHSGMHPVQKWAFRVLDGLHYVLPKTTEADYITRILRRTIAGEDGALRDEEGALVVEENPKGFTPLFQSSKVDLSQDAAIWVHRDESGAETARLELRRTSRDLDGEEGDNGRKTRSAGSEASRLLKELRARDIEATKSNGSVSDTYAAFVDWPEGGKARQTAFFRFGDSIFILEATFDGSWDEDQRDEVLRAHLDEYRFASDSALYSNPKDWFRKQFGWTAPLRFNAFFSIGSTLAFVVATLLVAWFFLRRIDF